MALIPGWLVGLLTFPGIVVHELGHLLLCKVTGVKVLGWCLFRLKQPMGFVIHEQPESVFKGFLITFGPFFLNSILTVILAIVSFFVRTIFPLNLLFLWLAFSVGAHSFPSTGDAKSLFSQTIESIKKMKIWNAIFLPFVILIYVGAILSIFWADFIYAGMIIVGTQNVVSEAVYQVGGEWGNKFENQNISFNYPVTINRIESGKSFQTIKENREEGGSELYFLAKSGPTLIVVDGSKEESKLSEIETLGMVKTMLEFSERDRWKIDKNAIESINDMEWFEINAVNSTDPADVYSKIEGLTICNKKIIDLQIAGKNYEKELFKRITQSFNCKQAN